MPPMPDSCQQLLRKKDQGNLNLQMVIEIEIVGKDLIFSGRIVGQARKAIYGITPKSIQEAVGRNLGIDTIVNFCRCLCSQRCTSRTC